MNGENTTIELNHAYVWDCCECGRENWQRSVTRTIPMTEKQAHKVAIEDFGDDNPEMIEKIMGMEIMIRTCPYNVICVHCEAEFAVAME